MDEFEAFDDTYETNLRVERLKKGITQAKLAELLGVKQPDVSLMERGLQPINRTRAEKLADIFGIEARIFLEE